MKRKSKRILPQLVLGLALPLFLLIFPFHKAYADGGATSTRESSGQQSQQTYPKNPNAGWECNGKSADESKATYEAMGDFFKITCRDDMSTLATINFECVCVKPEICENGRTSKTVTMPCPVTEDTAVCGNGMVEKGEACDDSNLLDGDGCTAACKSESCGDGIVQSELNEKCDDKNKSDNDGCSALCQVEACGDGIKQTGEECDDKNNTDGDGCNQICKNEFCGDGTRQAALGEECDDGNTKNNDGCSGQCKTEKCGDKSVQVSLNEECDDGNLVAGDGCSASCKPEICGDSIVQSGLGEQCDEGRLNGTSNSKCSISCKIASSESHCNNQKTSCVLDKASGKYYEWLICGDDNSILSGPGRSCDQDCEGEKANNNPECVQTACGNGKTEPGEECDLGSGDNGNKDAGACTTSCKLPACGDGFTQESAGEKCDEGSKNGTANSQCQSDCTTKPNVSCEIDISCANAGNLTVVCSSSSLDSAQFTWNLTGQSNIQPGSLNPTTASGSKITSKYVCGQCDGQVCTDATLETATIGVSVTSKSCTKTESVQVLCA